MLFVTQQVLLPQQHQVVALPSNVSSFFLFKVLDGTRIGPKVPISFRAGGELNQAWNYYNEWIEEPGGYIFVYFDVPADWMQFLDTW